MAEERLDSPAGFEQEYRDRLRGASCVLEAGLTPDDRLRLRKVCTAVVLKSQDPSAVLASRYPASYVCHLVAEGTYSYDGGLWPHVIPQVAAQQYDFDGHPGYRFALALETLGLESFASLPVKEKTFKWVGRIMAHVGVPAPTAITYLEALKHQLRYGWDSAEDLLSGWRASRAQLRALHAPTRHFLLYGGETAVDFVDRSIALLGGSEAQVDDVHGLPAYLVEAAHEVGIVRRGASGAGPAPSLRIPRPQLAFDPFDGLGPVVRVPLVSPDHTGGRWRVDNGERLVEFAASSLRGEDVQLSPARSWRAEFEACSGQLREWTFEGLDRLPFLVAAADGTIINGPTSLRLDDATVLHPDSSTVQLASASGDLPPEPTDELPQPAGKWSGFRAIRVELQGVEHLRVMDLAHNSSSELRVLPTRARPRLAGPEVEGVTTLDGTEVFSDWPALELPELPGVGPGDWGIAAAFADGERVLSASHSFRDLRSSLEGLELTPIEISVRGPLGSDLRTRFVVVPGLKLNLPDHVVLPTEGVGETRVWAGADLSIDGGGSSAPIPWSPGVSDLSFSVGDGFRSIELRAGLPRLVWTVTHETKAALSPDTEIQRVPTDEFDDDLADLLTVRTGRAGTSLRLLLVSRREGAAFAEVQTGSEGTTRGPDGRWFFDLAEFADTIRNSEDPRLSFVLEVNEVRRQRVADLVASVDAADLVATSRHDGEFSQVHIRFAQRRPVTDRVVRLWSRARPWEPAVESSIPNGDNEVVVTDQDGALPPGPYIAEIAVPDDWVAPSRPDPSANSVAVIQLGSKEERERHIAGLDPYEDLELLEIALDGDFIPAHTDELSLSPRSGAALADAMVATLADIPLGHRPPKGFPLLRKLAAVQPELLLDGLASSGRSRAANLRLSLLAVRTVRRERAQGLGGSPDAWRTAPVLAAALDVSAAHEGDEAAQSRCLQFLGWSPGEPISTEGGLVTMNEAGKDADELQRLRTFLNLVPSTILDPTTLQVANFEWLIAQKETSHSVGGALAPSGWFSLFEPAARDIDSDLRLSRVSVPGIADLLPHLDQRFPGSGVFDWAAVPGVVLALAIEYLTEGPRQSRAREGLERALAFAPGLVEHDLALCLALQASPVASNA